LEEETGLEFKYRSVKASGDSMALSLGFELDIPLLLGLAEQTAE